MTDRGRAQAIAVRAVCASFPISAVIHSPLSRAAETAALVADGRWPLTADIDLQEAHLGIYQGVREDNPADPFIREWIGGRAITGAETYSVVKLRVVSAMAGIFARVPGTPLIVAHAGVYHALREAMGVPMGLVRHCVPYLHEPDGATWRVTKVDG